MPFYLKESAIISRAAGLRSALIVPCGFCPAVSLAVKEDKPYMQFFRRFLKTGAYEAYVRELSHRLEQNGIKTDVFKIKLPHHMVACMWTTRRRKQLAKRAAAFDGTVVLGCGAAVENVKDALGSLNNRVIQGMEIEGLMNLLPVVRFPLNISLVVKGMTSVEETKEPKEGIGNNVLTFRRPAFGLKETPAIQASDASK